MGESKGAGVGAGDVVAVGFPLIGETGGAEAIGISDVGGISGEGLPLCGCAVDDYGASGDGVSAPFCSQKNDPIGNREINFSLHDLGLIFI